MSYSHEPVLLKEIVEWLKPETAGCFVDCTLGLGGHTRAILEASAQTQVIGLDQDAEALEIARQRLAEFGDRVRFAHANFKEVAEVLRNFGIEAVQGLLADLGVSSLQFDSGERGFSFAADAPLDMRMDRREPRTAADLLAELSEAELADLIFEYGEERGARKIARRIVKERAREPIVTTRQLADLTIRALNIKGHWRIHPATRTFQALRIAVNNELTVLENFIPSSISLLASGGRLAIISFHSLEDRIVKRSFQRESGRCLCEDKLHRLATERQAIEKSKDAVLCKVCGASLRVRILTRKPIRPDDVEIMRNPRSRSASLRVCERL
ncbi:MAG: 16S rRNA (cytosine(1402)-N(4))-methyltransferase RsmH [Acidobacteriota bacterium]